jgi:dolichol-phosphate mannosyltransferase
LTRPGVTPRRVDLTVVIPTRRDDVATIDALRARLDAALAPLHADIVVVDDSDHDTRQVLEHLAHARGTWVLVMDGDLRHAPEVAAALARTALRHDVDVVVGTRYAGAEPVPAVTRFTKALFPRLLATITDPLSGLYAFRTAVVDLSRLRPGGVTLLPDILIRNPAARVAEFAYGAVDPAASVPHRLRLLRHVARLRADRLVGQLRSGPASPGERRGQFGRMVGFGLVGLSGVAVNTAVLWLLYAVAGLHHLLGAALATQASTTWNFLLVDRLIYRAAKPGSRRGRAARFLLMNNLLLLTRLPVLQVLVWGGAEVLTANAVTLVALFLLRFLVSDRVIYSGGRPRRDPVRRLVDPGRPAAPPAPHRRGVLTYRYDVAGTVTVGSQIRLPELEFFRAQWVADAELDIAVRVGDVGRRRPRGRARMVEYTEPTRVRYEEHLGRLGANFSLDLSDPITVTVGPLLARSPHVVYTNLVEALLRFVMISRERMLLHSACVEIGGTGVMLSARTDTGKTATVLRLLRDHGGRFLSDDMTVVDAAGNATGYPKPLTISAHTVRAVRSADLTPAEWRRLRVQSLLHSRGGRDLALVLSRFNLPIMGINALTQNLVPPPKFTVDRLVDCRFGGTTRVRELFVIERGMPRVTDLDADAALDRMIANTDDAYGFPPFRYLAPALTIAGAGYQELRQREREILAGFLSGVRTRIVASDTFGWADEIPRLITGDLDQ